MSNLSELWQSAENSLAEEEYESAIKTLEEIKKFSSQLRPEKLILLKQSFIEAYIHSGDYNLAAPLCLSLINTNKPELQAWAKEKLELINPAKPISTESETENNLAGEQPVKLKSVAEFKEFCLANLISDLKKFEQQRKKAIFSIAIATIVFVLALYLISQATHLFAYIPECPQISPRTTIYGYRRSIRICRRITGYQLALIGAIATSCLISILAWITFIQRTITLYGRSFKNKVIAKILTFVDPNQKLTYVEQVNTAQMLNLNLPAINAAVANSRLFNSKSSPPTHILKYDCVLGKINNVEIFWSQIGVQRTSGYDLLRIANSLDNLVWRLGIDNPVGKLIANIVVFCLKILVILLIPLAFLAASRNITFLKYLETHLSWGRKTIFQGLFFEANFPKQLERSTVLFISTKGFLSKFRDDIGQAYSTVKLEDPEFNRLFHVNSNDQVNARYILSTSLISRIKDLHRQVNKPIQISFVRDKVYLAIAYEHYAFEPRLFKSMVSFAPLKEYFVTLNFMLSIVQDLNLNLKIWRQPN